MGPISKDLFDDAKKWKQDYHKRVKAFRGFVQHMRDEIEERAFRGLGRDGRLTPWYNPAYARRKKGGRRWPVTLHDTNEMFDSLKVRPTGPKVEGRLTGAEMYFGSYRWRRNATLWKWHWTGAGNLPKRRPGLPRSRVKKLEGEMGIKIANEIPANTRVHNVKIKVTMTP